MSKGDNKMTNVSDSENREDLEYRKVSRYCEDCGKHILVYPSKEDMNPCYQLEATSYYCSDCQEKYGYPSFV